MKKNNYVGIVIGLLFLVIGGGYLAKALGIIEEFTIIFKGCWTMFIIVPCFCGLLGKGGGKIGYLIGIAIGLFFLLEAQDVLDFDQLWALLLAAVCILLGLNLVLPKRVRRAKEEERESAGTDRFDRAEHVTAEASSYTVQEDGVVCEEAPEVTVEPSDTSYQEQDTGEQVVCSAVFAGRDIRVDNSGFYGANLSAIFGGIDLNLKNAIIRRNVTIEVRAVFGGIDLVLPSNVRVVVDVTPILGGVENGTRTPLGADENTPTVYIKGTCLFGGVEVK